MKDWPNAFWAALFILMAVVLAIIALLRPSQQTVTMAVVTIASNIVSGSFGYISGHKDGQNSITVPQTATSATTVSVNPNPPKPTDPPKES